MVKFYYKNSPYQEPLPYRRAEKLNSYQYQFLWAREGTLHCQRPLEPVPEFR